jgi:hypothetical protein
VRTGEVRAPSRITFMHSRNLRRICILSSFVRNLILVKRHGLFTPRHAGEFFAAFQIPPASLAFPRPLSLLHLRARHLRPPGALPPHPRRELPAASFRAISCLGHGLRTADGRPPHDCRAAPFPGGGGDPDAGMVRGTLVEQGTGSTVLISFYI